MKDRIRHFVTKTASNGAQRHYWQPSASLRRAGWPAQRLPDDLAAARALAMTLNLKIDQWREHHAAEADIHQAAGARAAKRRAARPANMRGLIADYRQSPRFAALAANTRRNYGWCLRLIADELGDLRPEDVTAALAEALFARLAGRKSTSPRFNAGAAGSPARAHAALRVLRLLLGFARLAPPRWQLPRPARRDAPQIWTPHDIAALCHQARSMGFASMADAVRLNYWLGQRESDILALRWGQADWRENTITLTQAKTGARVIIPLPPLWPGAGWPEKPDPDAPLLICETTGAAWSPAHFRKVFARMRAACAAAHPHMAGLTFMRLRHTAITRMAEAGCSIPEIAAVSGHSLAHCNTVLERYLVRTAPLAASAMARRIEKEAVNAVYD